MDPGSTRTSSPVSPPRSPTAFPRPADRTRVRRILSHPFASHESAIHEFQKFLKRANGFGNAKSDTAGVHPAFRRNGLAVGNKPHRRSDLRSAFPVGKATQRRPDRRGARRLAIERFDEPQGAPVLEPRPAPPHPGGSAGLLLVAR